MALIQYRGTGRRKRAVARVILRPGSGKVTVNGKELAEYFSGRELFLEKIAEPLEKTQNKDKFDVIILVDGGGVKGQAEAVRLGIARALLDFNDGHKPVLKALHMLTRDAREVERKHYYKRKARKGPQYSKR